MNSFICVCVMRTFGKKYGWSFLCCKWRMINDHLISDNLRRSEANVKQTWSTVAYWVRTIQACYCTSLKCFTQKIHCSQLFGWKFHWLSIRRKNSMDLINEKLISLCRKALIRISFFSFCANKRTFDPFNRLRWFNLFEYKSSFWHF